jgi:predicted DNA binding protein
MEPQHEYTWAMATRITCHLSTDDFALDQTLNRIPGLSLTCERVAASGDEVVTPLIRFRFQESDFSSLEAALADDPTVDECEVLARGTGEALCHVQWSSRVRLLVQMLTATDALVLSGAASQERWTFGLLFPTRDALSQLDRFCSEHNLSLDVSCVETWGGDGLNPAGMTDEQHEALTTAYELGYFKVPREIVLDDVATEIGISHQALSERLRRGHNTLIQRVLHDTSTEPGAKSDTEQNTETEDEFIVLPNSQPPIVTID